MPKLKNSNATFWVIFKQCDLHKIQKSPKYLNFPAKNCNFWKFKKVTKWDFLNIYTYCASHDFFTNFLPIQWAGKLILFDLWFSLFARCLKITEKVSSNIASEASYAYILSGQKLIKNAKNAQFWRIFENLKLAVKQC